MRTNVWCWTTEPPAWAGPRVGHLHGRRPQHPQGPHEVAPPASRSYRHARDETLGADPRVSVRPRRGLARWLPDYVRRAFPAPAAPRRPGMSSPLRPAGDIHAPTVGIPLCTGKGAAEVRYALVHRSIRRCGRLPKAADRPRRARVGGREHHERLTPGGETFVDPCTPEACASRADRRKSIEEPQGPDCRLETIGVNESPEKNYQEPRNGAGESSSESRDASAKGSGYDQPDTNESCWAER